MMEPIRHGYLPQQPQHRRLLLGASGLRILRALGAGQTDPQQLAALGDDRLHCSEQQQPGKAIEGLAKIEEGRHLRN